MGRIVGWIVALCALVRFLPSVNEEVPLKIIFLGKCLVTLWTIVLLVPTVGLPVFGKATSICKCLRTQFTRLSICHFLFSPPLLQSLWWLVTINANINYIGWNTFPFTKKGWLGWKLNFHSWKGMISTKGESYSRAGLATWPWILQLETQITPL